MQRPQSPHEDAADATSSSRTATKMQSTKVVATLKADGNVYPTAYSDQKHPNDGSQVDSPSIMAPSQSRMFSPAASGAASGAAAATPNNAVVDLGKQLLQFARVGDVQGVKAMLARGAPFTSDWLGMSALHFAAMNNHYEIADILLRGGINRDCRTKVDRTPLHYATYYGNDLIVELLLANKCSINCRDMLRMTPLLWAVEKRFKSIVRLLLKYQADVTLPSKFGSTPIAIAVLTEQPDILEELQAAKETQLNRKFDEETQKETSEAVNSIMGEDLGGLETDDITLMDVDANRVVDDEAGSSAAASESPAVNLLKDHGIAMMKDDGDDSKLMLNTALKNGRKLVLSEGGKLLLNDTKEPAPPMLLPGQMQVTPFKGNPSNNNHHKSAAVNSKSPQQQKSHVMGSGKAMLPAGSPLKQDGDLQEGGGVNKNKKIRIISLNDFKKLYGNAFKGPHRIPPALANSPAMKQLTAQAKQNGVSEPRKICIPNGLRPMVVPPANSRPAQPPHQRIQTKYMKPPPINSALMEADDELIQRTVQQQHQQDESEAEFSDTDLRAIATSPASATTTKHSRGLITVTASSPMKSKHYMAAATAAAKASSLVNVMPVASVKVSGGGGAVGQMCVLPGGKRLDGVMVGGMRALAAAATANRGGQSVSAHPTNSNRVAITTVNANGEKRTSYIPLLNLPELTRQMFEMRKQYDEMRRKLELALKENEQMRQRLERLESLMLVEHADGNYTVS